jgi:hypothetical protein
VRAYCWGDFGRAAAGNVVWRGSESGDLVMRVSTRSTGG